MELEYFVVCRSVSIDIDTDELTFSGILEDVFVDEFPDVIPRLVAISAWRAGSELDQEDYQAALRVEPPGDEGMTFAMNFVRGSGRHRAIQSVVNVPLDCPGQVVCKVSINGEHAATHIVTIHAAQQADSPAKGESPQVERAE